MKRKTLYGMLVLALVLSLSSAVFAQEGGPQDRFDGRELPAAVEALKLDAPMELTGVSMNALDASLFGAEGDQEVIIRLKTESVGEQKVHANAAKTAKKHIKTEQADLLDRVFELDPNAQVLGHVQVVMNAVFVEVDSSVLPALANDPAVQRIAPVAGYRLDLSETVPYIGASDVQAAGYDGSGVRVAVLDSGIDYTHAALGGSGDPDDYAANDPTIIEPGTFPTAKVVGGYDFVGSNWAVPGDTEEPDPDPLDDGPAAGHGTHVAHIIGGHNGVAPGVDLYAVKVCSSISNYCSGVALIQGMEFAVDPDGDGDPGDHLDIVNMSLGSIYGNAFDDDLSLAVDNATEIGVLTVAAAGNGADKPYVSDTPGDAPTAISVAQTNVPSAVMPLMEVTAPTSIAGFYEAVFQPWSAPLVGPIEAPLQYGDGAGGNLLGCSLGPDPNSVDPADAPFSPGSLAGKIVLVDRGVCNFSIKIFNIQRGGGLAGIIGLVAPGDPFAGGLGAGGPFTIPGYMISQADSTTLKSGLPDTVVRFDPAVGIPLVGTVVGSSSRGPAMGLNIIKPEIGAPGASVSAIAGTGTGEGPFGGTSGAAPMVSGSAALLLQGFDTNGKGQGKGKAKGLALDPVQVKALLMNNAETDIDTDPSSGKAPITRIGAGEVRVDRAINAPAVAWDADAPSGALSFGFVEVADDVVTLTKWVRVHNYSNTWRTYDIIPTVRFGDDVANGAVSVSAPAHITLNPGFGDDEYFEVTLTIDGSKLRDNAMNSGSEGANSAPLTAQEYDGYLILDDGEHPIHLAWHVLPRKAARVVPERTTLDFGSGSPDVIGLGNTGVGTAQNDAYSLLALSPNLPEGGRGEQSPTPDIRGVGINTFPVRAGFCSAEDSFLWVFAINTWERQSHLVPVSHQVLLDTDRDGSTDYIVLNRDLSGFGTVSDGRQVTWALDLSTNTASAFFFAEHSTNTGNTVLWICGEQVGLTGTDMLATTVDMDVYTQDFYYGGPGDWVTGLTVTPLGEQYFGFPEDIPGKSEGTMAVYNFGPFPRNSPELGVMLFTNGDRSTGNRGGATQDTEALFFMAR